MAGGMVGSEGSERGNGGSERCARTVATGGQPHRYHHYHHYQNYNYNHYHYYHHFHGSIVVAVRACSGSGCSSGGVCEGQTRKASGGGADKGNTAVMEWTI